jgi:hypothetical protein
VFVLLLLKKKKELNDHISYFFAFFVAAATYCLYLYTVSGVSRSQCQWFQLELLADSYS